MWGSIMGDNAEYKSELSHISVSKILYIMSTANRCFAISRSYSQISSILMIWLIRKTENGKVYEWDSARSPKVIFDINTLPGSSPVLSASQFSLSIGKGFLFLYFDDSKK